MCHKVAKSNNKNKTSVVPLRTSIYVSTRGLVGRLILSTSPITSPQLLVGIGRYDAGKGINSEKIEKILQWKK